MKSSKQLRNMLAAVSENVVGINCRFDTGDFAKTYTFKATKALAESLDKGDPVVVNSQDDIKIVYFVSTEEFDPDENVDYKWAFQKVDATILQDLLAKETEAVKKLRIAQKTAKRKQVFDALGMDDEQVKLLTTF